MRIAYNGQPAPAIPLPPEGRILKPVAGAPIPNAPIAAAPASPDAGTAVLGKTEFQAEFDFAGGQFLGGGAFGKVYKCQSRFDGQQYAIKRQETNRLPENKWAIDEFVRMKSISEHKNIIGVKKAFNWTEPPSQYVLAIQMELGVKNLQQEIEERLEKQNFFSAAELDRLFSQCLDALHYMAARKSLYHRDIKPENILLDVAGDVKITDFGCSKKLADSKMAAMTLVGTPYFLSPKLWEAYCAQQQPGQRVPHDLEKSDVFSLGLSFLQCAALVNVHELACLNQRDGQEKKLTKLISRVRAKKHEELIRSMLALDEAQRATYPQLLQKYYPEVLKRFVQQFPNLVASPQAVPNSAMNCAQHGAPLAFICCACQEVLCSQCRHRADHQDELVDLAHAVRELLSERVTLQRLAELRRDVQHDAGVGAKNALEDVKRGIKRATDEAITHFTELMKRVSAEKIDRYRKRFEEAARAAKDLETKLQADQTRLERLTKELAPVLVRGGVGFLLKDARDLQRLQQLMREDETISNTNFKAYQRTLEAIGKQLSKDSDFSAIASQQLEGNLPWSEFKQRCQKNVDTLFMQLLGEQNAQPGVVQNEVAAASDGNVPKGTSSGSTQAPTELDFIRLQSAVRSGDVICALHADDSLFIIATKNRRLVRRYTAQAGNEASTITFSIVRALENCAVQQLVLAGCEDGLMRIYNETNLAQLKVVSAHIKQIQRLRYSQAHQLLISASGDYRVIAWRLVPPPAPATGILNCEQYATTQSHTGAVTDMIILQNLVLSSGFDRQLVVHDLIAKTVQVHPDIHTTAVACITAISAEQLAFATGSFDGHIKIWNYVNTEDLQMVQRQQQKKLLLQRTIDLQCEITNLLYLPGYDALLTLSNTGQLCLAGTKTAQLEHKQAHDCPFRIIPHLLGVQGLLFTSDGLELKKWLVEKPPPPPQPPKKNLMLQQPDNQSVRRLPGPGTKKGGCTGGCSIW